MSLIVNKIYYLHLKLCKAGLSINKRNDKHVGKSTFSSGPYVSPTHTIPYKHRNVIKALKDQTLFNNTSSTSSRDSEHLIFSHNDPGCNLMSQNFEVMRY